MNEKHSGKLLKYFEKYRSEQNNFNETVGDAAKEITETLESALTLAEIKEYISIAILCGKAFVVLFVLYKLFYNTRLRFFFTRSKIPLEKHNEIYCQNISNFFARYYYIGNNQLNYDIDNFKDKCYQIQTILSTQLTDTRIQKEDVTNKKIKNNLYSKSADKNIFDVLEKNNKIIYNKEVEIYK